jgi:hypothetical protein
MAEKLAAEEASLLADAQVWEYVMTSLVGGTCTP